MRWLGIISVLSFIFLASSASSGDNGYVWNKSQVYYSSKEHQLRGHVIKEINAVKTVSQCAMQCYKADRCESLNYQRNDSVCQLSSVSDVQVPVSAAPGWHYYRRDTYSIEQKAIGPCSSQPCHNDAGCVNRDLASGESSFLCVCKIGWHGETCMDRELSAAWGAWPDWEECSVTCGAGWQTRMRKCISEEGNVLSPLECYGADKELQECTGLQPCPYWNEWSEWDTCSSLCGPGIMTRERQCQNGGTPGEDRMCMGPTNETMPCLQTACSAPVKVDGGIGEGRLLLLDDTTDKWLGICADGWTQENTAVACRQLGYDHTHSSASFVSVPGETSDWHVTCSGEEGSIQSCERTHQQCTSGLATLQCTVHGGWSTWSGWEVCSVTCAHGIQLRHRECNHPPPLREGDDCADSNEDSRECVLDPCPVDGLWKTWAEWNECTVSCGGGKQDRFRECSVPMHGGADCLGNSDESRQCNTHNCPINCVWDDWSSWGQCSTTCGGGQQMRTRTQDGPHYGGEECTGVFDDWQDCNTHECPIDCVWEEWGAWKECSVSCGGGEKERERSSEGPFHGGAVCDGELTSVDECNMHECPVDCVWNHWGDWRQCNRTCGGGWQDRTRTAFGPFHGGIECIGKYVSHQDCNTHDCPVDCFWNPWGEWKECSLICGGGEQFRYRTKEGPQHGGIACDGLAEDRQDCNIHPCPIDGYWGDWSAWDACSQTCETGTQKRYHTCVEPQHGGNDCEGPSEVSQDCFEKECPVDGVWDTWGVWSRCTESCGGGEQERSRTCHAPQHGGLECAGETKDTQDCNTHLCPVDGYWNEWSDWAGCTLTCGTGVQDRDRECVPGREGGTNCTGEHQQQQDCNVQPCPVDGYWHTWSDWFTCDVTCGGGSHKRVRTCNEPLYGGADCSGKAEDSRVCSDNPCPVDGQWSAWSGWSTCTVTCGGGDQRKYRLCGGAANGGKECEGDEETYQDCNVDPCPIDCVWSVYGSWYECNRTCGGGHQFRERTADGPVYGGEPCDGDAKDWRMCNTESCAIHCVWLDWSEWTECDLDCGGGHQSRQRGHDGPFYGGDPCDGEPDETRLCNEHPCPVACVWEEWSEWDPCNVSCGGGGQGRYRDQRGALYGGDPCIEEPQQQRDCNMHECPVDCVWSDWSEWDSCDFTCGGGSQSKYRQTQGPQYGGLDCTGEAISTQECNTIECPVDCVWDTWSAWDACSLTCGGGVQGRTRTTTGPFHDGAACIGEAAQPQDCNILECPIDCKWEEWESWQECDVSCGGGTQIRIRGSVGPFHKGAECVGSTEDNQPCNTHECPVDCVWSEWGDFEPCSVSCGGGSQTRHRQEVGPFHEGAPCEGPSSDTQECSTINCPIDGIWKMWATWSECTVTCGGGIMHRTRECQPPQYNGLACVGLSNEKEACNDEPCPIPGDWLPWNGWGTCSATCGGGTQIRNRECDMNSYGDLTAPCEGLDVDSQDCQIYDCLPYEDAKKMRRRAKTCDEWGTRGLVDSNWVEIDPDGDGGWSPFRVWCDNSGENKGVTIIHHNFESETPVQGYEGAGEYEADLDYQDQSGNTISTDQVMSLVDSSAECKQFIRWSCSSAAFNPDLTQLANEGKTAYKLTYWKNRYMEEMNYWGGASPTMDDDTVTCACFKDGLCADSSKRCNCDSNDEGVWRSDEGYLTEKGDLPVTKFQAGDTGHPTEEGKFEVGPLTCQGIASPMW